VKIPSLEQVLKYFKLVMVTTTGHRVQQIWKASKGTVVKVTIEVVPTRFRFNGHRYHSDKL
jgi:hypothetical protein